MRLQKKIVDTINSLLNVIVILVLTLSLVYATYALWDNQQIIQAVDDVLYQLLEYKPDKENPGPSFEELLKINEDVKAWVEIDGTGIDYPVVQGEDNLAYLNKDVFGNFALAGSIFLDTRNSPDFTDNYSLLYGHDMVEGKMFGDVKNFKDEEYFNDHLTGSLITPDKAYDLDVYAVLLVPSNSDEIFNPDMWMDDLTGLEQFISEEAIYTNPQALKDGDQDLAFTDQRILTLTTCSSEYTQARTILITIMKESNTKESDAIETE